MTWNLTGDRPIWLQLAEQIQLRIIAGEYPAGERLPSVRDLAAEAAVNPNTMQKALSELERTGLLYSQRTSGRYVTQDQEMLRGLRQRLAEQQTGELLRRVGGLGFSGGETLAIMEGSAPGKSRRSADGRDERRAGAGMPAAFQDLRGGAGPG